MERAMGIEPTSEAWEACNLTQKTLDWRHFCDFRNGLIEEGKAVGKPLRGKPKTGFPLRLEIPQRRGIPTFPQPRRRRSSNLKPDISCATKTGHFNLLTTVSLERLTLQIAQQSSG
jgi:hypothetical protein